MSQQEVLCPACRGGNSPQAIHCQWCGLGLRESPEQQVTPSRVYRTPAPAPQQASRGGCAPILGALMLGGAVILGALWITGAMNPPTATIRPTIVVIKPTSTTRADARIAAPPIEDFPTATAVPVLPTEPPPLPTDTPVPPLVEQPITLSGKGDIKTPPFELPGGTYISEWTVPEPDGSCVFYLRLHSTAADSFVNEDLASASSANAVREDDPASRAGSTYIYNVKPGQYYVESNTTCSDWTVTLRRP